MATRTKNRRRNPAWVLQDQSGVLVLETRGASLTFDKKGNTITLNAAKVVLNCKEILLAGTKGKQPVKLSEILRRSTERNPDVNDHLHRIENQYRTSGVVYS